MPTRSIFLHAALLFVLSGLSPVPAEDERASRNVKPPRPSISIPQIRKAPQIDGLLDDEAWSRAAVIDNLIEVEPDPGERTDPGTKIKLMRCQEFLYVGFVCLEPEIDKLVLQDMHRDGWQHEDDAVKIALDTFRDGKSGFYFLLSAAGGRLDALVSDNGQRLNYMWDGFWSGRAKVLADRWTAEFAIPFKTLAFGKNGIWRANFERWRGPDRSRHRWTGTEREFRITTMSEAGELSGMSGLDQGLGLEFRPYAKMKRERIHDPREAHTLGDLGGELNWDITPQLTGSLTINTDFAETEVDEQRVNLTRFPLFFPEKRNFFLQDSTYFEFGWGTGHRESPDLLPFLSRRIGLSPEGEEIPIDVGTRLTGRIDDLDLGVLAVRTGANGNNIPASDLFVIRPALRLSEELTVGGIVTSGDPASDDYNMVTGGDIRFVSTDRLPGLFSMNAYFLRSFDEATDELGSAYGIKSTLQTTDWYFSLDTLGTQEEFDPALGFVRRPGERRFKGSLKWEPKPENGSIREYGFGFYPTVWTEPDGSIISKSLTTRLFEAEWHTGDEIDLSHTLHSDRLRGDFEPIEGHTVPAGEHTWHTLSAGFSTSRKRPLSARINLHGGGWYNGRGLRFSTGGTWIPCANLELNVEYVEDRIRLPDSRFTTRIERLKLNYDFSPDMRLATMIQADNVSDNLGLQSRFRWILVDGREIFFVINSCWLEERDGTIVPVEQDYTIKVVYAWRF